MNAKESLRNKIKALSPSCAIKNAQEVFVKHPLSHLPIVEKGKLIGCISKRDALAVKDASTPISNHFYLVHFFCAQENTSILALIKLFVDSESDIIPILDSNQRYLGYCELNEILDVFCLSPFMEEEGVCISVQKNKKSFSLVEVSQIVESNGGKILGIYIASETQSQRQVMIKTVSKNTNEIIQSFRRYNYLVISEEKDDLYIQNLKDRSDYLQKYLTM